jgi:hypothetical protein
MSVLNRLFKRKMLSESPPLLTQLYTKKSTQSFCHFLAASFGCKYILAFRYVRNKPSLSQPAPKPILPMPCSPRISYFCAFLVCHTSVLSLHAMASVLSLYAILLCFPCMPYLPCSGHTCHSCHTCRAPSPTPCLAKQHNYYQPSVLGQKTSEPRSRSAPRFISSCPSAESAACWPFHESMTIFRDLP